VVGARTIHTTRVTGVGRHGAPQLRSETKLDRAARERLAVRSCAYKGVGLGLAFTLALTLPWWPSQTHRHHGARIHRARHNPHRLRQAEGHVHEVQDEGQEGGDRDVSNSERGLVLDAAGGQPQVPDEIPLPLLRAQGREEVVHRQAQPRVHGGGAGAEAGGSGDCHGLLRGGGGGGKEEEGAKTDGKGKGKGKKAAASAEEDEGEEPKAKRSKKAAAAAAEGDEGEEPKAKRSKKKGKAAATGERAAAPQLTPAQPYIQMLEEVEQYGGGDADCG